MNEMDGSQLFGIPWFDGPSLWQLLFRFAINLIVCWIIIGLFYYRKSQRKDYYFTFMLFSITIFFMIFLMDNVKVQIGFALGLFAIFGMIRYRTETIPIREMTYLFVTIGLSVINGLAMTTSYAELFFTNIFVVLAVWFFEFIQGRKRRLESKIILYEKIDLIKVGREEELKADLVERTGLDIVNVEVGHINFLKDTAYIKVYYRTTSQNINTINHLTKVKSDNYFNA
ncbi:MAG: DUF4956 domain-containing protein [Bacteroidales bacterium]|nr:DUF4956 domain-containing protein [Bacteroidales bacterium]MBO7647182.1 DUF4956 domain-containing protein [Bacteroidales bacterium]